MSIDVYMAFLMGAVCGVVFGIAMSAIFVAISNKIEGRNDL